MKNVNNKVIFSILLLMLILIVFISISLLKKNKRSEKPVTIVKLKNCHIQQTPCSLKLQDLTLEVSMDKNVYYLSPFHFTVKRTFITPANSNRSEIESIFVDFKMKNMNMGVNRFQLIKSEPIKDVYAWEGKALLPICVTGRADWVTELDILTKDAHYRLIFPILVKQPAHKKVNTDSRRK